MAIELVTKRKFRPHTTFLLRTYLITSRTPCCTELATEIHIPHTTQLCQDAKTTSPGQQFSHESNYSTQYAHLGNIQQVS